MKTMAYTSKMMTRITLLTLLVGVATLSTAAADQSDAAFQDDQPMGSLEDHVGQRRVETPEVVLQLKYDRGELNKIYLAQFRKGKEPWLPSVPARTNLCADLCHAGLGGAACGSECAAMLPVGLQAALLSGNQKTYNQSTANLYGEPRVSVCPTLCDNFLGEPLCNCSAGAGARDVTTDWSAVCAAFCVTDRYVLGGCPNCEESWSGNTSVRTGASRILDTEQGWVAWCSVQCRQGHGGAACNCDRSPLQ